MAKIISEVHVPRQSQAEQNKSAITDHVIYLILIHTFILCWLCIV